MVAVAAQADQAEGPLGGVDDVAQLGQARLREDVLGEERRYLHGGGIEILPGDGLQRQAAALDEPEGATLEEPPVGGAPLGLVELRATEVLEGPDRDDGVVRPGRLMVPPILEPGLGPFRRWPCAGLVRAQREPGDVADLALVRQVPHHRPPPAPDVEDPGRTVHLGAGGVPLELGQLRRIEVVVEVARPQGARIDHAAVQPEPVEVAAHIVVVLDGVLGRPAAEHRLTLDGHQNTTTAGIRTGPP